MKQLIILILLSCNTFYTFSQTLKKMEPEVFDIWKKIETKQISNDGNWVIYNIGNEAGDTQLKIYNNKTGYTLNFDRGYKAKISYDSQWLIFQVGTSVDTIKALKRKKIDQDKFPKDTLVIYNLVDRSVVTIDNVKSFEVPQKWDNWIVYQKAFVATSEEAEKDKKTKSSSPKLKKKDGTLLVFYDLRDKNSYSFPGSLDYTVAKNNPNTIFSNSGKFSGYNAGIYQFDFKKKKANHIFGQKGKYHHLTLDDSGQQAAFIADLDTTKTTVRPLNLYHWKDKKITLVEKSAPNKKTGNYFVSRDYRPHFSEDGKTLYYGVAPFPILQDTALLKEDIVNVEVWHYQDARLYPQQEKHLDDDKKQTYLRIWNINNNKITQITDPRTPWFRLADKGNAQNILTINDKPYYKSASWESYPSRKDIYIKNKDTGLEKTVAKKLKASPKLSPKGDYVYWFNQVDTAWFVHHISTSKTIQLTDNKTVPFYDELNDRPMLPFSHGILGWADEDKFIYIYDRFDIWKIDPLAPANKKRLTNGRIDNITYRYIRLDKEKRSINPTENILLHQFNHTDKSSGYARLNLATTAIKNLTDGNFKFSKQVTKANNGNAVVFQKENFNTFPNLIYSDTSFSKEKQISDVNPQQKDYAWGSIELVKWTDKNNIPHEGMLVKPPNFNPKKKYPMLVNFYERSSHKLHQHIAPYPHRSTINYSYYANRGYLIFNPDIMYKVGHPGESAYQTVMSGVDHLIDQGFVDESNIGLQGHSWGGYQIAYITTKTNRFKCAESGAPVVNMFSAYGGIRWGSGMSRMFQYEQTQSRIGATIWESPELYTENSPIFELDKVETPLLILHNDKDGAVPWYQGIEYFVGLRRLGKPAWLLNYNGEPHWPLKRPNRLDFNKRMSQFFDYYLQDGSLPKWMKRGVPAIEKGILQGLESADD